MENSSTEDKHSRAARAVSFIRRNPWWVLGYIEALESNSGAKSKLIDKVNNQP